MRRFRFRASIGVPVLALVLAAAGGVMAATQSSDERALQPTRQSADQALEAKVSALLSKMTLEEKLEQIQLLPDFMVTEAEVWSVHATDFGPDAGRAASALAALVAVPDPMADDGAALLISVPAGGKIADVTAALVKAGAKVHSSALVGSHATRYRVSGARPAPSGR